MKKLYYYELYCEKEQVFNSDDDNFSLFIETGKKLKCYCKNRKTPLKLQLQLEKALKNKLGGYHIVGISDCGSKQGLVDNWDLNDGNDIIRLEI